MMIFHIVGNNFFWLFIILVICRVKQCVKTMEYRKFIIAAGIMGAVVYLCYLIILITNSNFPHQ